MRYDTGFRPSVHGYPFRNTWRDAVFGVFTSRGRCGGMVFASLDRFLTDVGPDISEDTAGHPLHDSALSRYIWRRQVESLATGFGTNLWRFVVHTLVAGRVPLRIGIAAHREARELVDLIAEGRPAPLGLVATSGLLSPFRNHQVLAYAAEMEADVLVLRIYDPNLPQRDDVTLEVSLSEPGLLVERVGARRTEWRSAFLERYS